MKKSLPLVSIGMPVYSDTFLRQALDSLLSQTYQNTEIIISDNASTDKTQNICRQYQRRSKKITYIRQVRNIGAANNFNFVLKKSHGKYFMWASDDDLWDKKFVSLLVEELEQDNSIALSVCAITIFNRSKNITVALSDEKTHTFFSSIKKYLDNSEQIGLFFYGIYRTKIIKRIRGLHMDTVLIPQRSSDILTVFQVLLNGNLTYVDKVLFNKRDSGNYLVILDLFKKSEVDEKLNLKVKRYFIYYVFNFIDLFYLIYYSSISNLDFWEKSNLILLCFRNFLIANKIFYANLLKGAYLVSKKLLSD